MSEDQIDVMAVDDAAAMEGDAANTGERQDRVCVQHY